MKKVSVAIMSGILVVTAAGAVMAMPKGPHSGWTGMGSGMHAPRGAMRELLDADGDGNVTKQEVAKFHEDRLKQADKNRDGALSSAEFTVMQENIKAEMRKIHERKKFERMDANGDGKVTAEELTAHHAVMFNRMDRNDDGMIGPDDRGHKKKMK
ncbi:EF-hand domain-containing protein [Emcibacter sp.]|uniref:EF-hand domain-containing protein n=1 Tax=Emcibacter sp. TaxID=1979954 RepID=UPI003A92AE54